MKNTNIRKIAYLGMLTAAALALYGIESLIPVPVPIPGIRLGLANFITLIALRKLGTKEASVILFLRIVIASLLFGQAVSFAYSLGGGFACLISESMLDAFLKKKNLPLISCAGGMIHNIFQLIVALFLLQTAGLIAYLPYLILSGIITGLFIGIAANACLKHIPSNLS